MTKASGVGGVDLDKRLLIARAVSITIYDCLKDCIQTHILFYAYPGTRNNYARTELLLN